MSYTANFSEITAYLGGINPASYTTVQDSGYVSLANYHRAVVLIHAGVLGDNVDFDLEQATSTAGAGAKAFDATGHDLLLTATTDNNTVSVIEIQTEELDVDGGFDCLNVEATPATQNGSIFQVEIWGFVPRYPPVPTTTLDSITN